MNQILGATTLVVGLALLGFMFYAMNAPTEPFSHSFTSHYADDARFYLVVGAGAVVAGGLMVAFARGR